MKHSKIILGIIFILGCLTYSADANQLSFRDVAPTPPMGWNSWNHFTTGINEHIILEIADAMAASGMKDVGYQYIVIDDGWQFGRVDHKTRQATVQPRDENGVLIADPEKFPNGIKFVADYVHGLGLKFGLYTSPGVRTCTGCGGSRHYEQLDLETFAAWGVDYIKLDWCGCRGDKREILTPWRTLLDQLDRPIVLSVNAGRDYPFLRTVANMWRTTGDIHPVWDWPPAQVHRFRSIREIIESQQGLEAYNGHGNWNDPDMLQVGNGTLTDDQNRAHFSMWAMFSAPLMAGNDLRNMTDSVRDILTNREVVAIDQDPRGDQGRKLASPKPGLEIWTKRLLQPTSGAIALLNFNDSPVECTVKFSELGLSDPVFLRDLWQHKDIGRFTGSLTTTVPADGVVMLKLSACEIFDPSIHLPTIPPEGRIFEAEADDLTRSLFSVETTYPGFTGSGYVLGHTRRSDCRLIWLVGCDRPGRYRIEMRYALGNTQTIPAVIGINETDRRNFPVPPTGGWDQWKTVSFEAELARRVNHICFYGGNNDLNIVAIDHLRVTPIEK